MYPQDYRAERLALLVAKTISDLRAWHAYSLHLLPEHNDEELRFSKIIDYMKDEIHEIYRS